MLGWLGSGFILQNRPMESVSIKRIAMVIGVTFHQVDSAGLGFHTPEQAHGICIYE